MMRFLLISSLSTISILASAQSWVGLGAGGNITNVNYQNAQGIRDTSIKGVASAQASFSFQLDLGAAKQTDESKLALVMNMGYKRASSKNKESTILETWTMDYAASSLLLRYIVGSRLAVSPYFEVGGFGDYLTSGVHLNGVEQFDISEDLRRFNAGAEVGAGICYYISSVAYGTLGVSYQRGLRNLEKGNQQANIHGTKIGIALFFSIDK